MKMKVLVALFSIIGLSCLCHADLLLKMTAEKTELLPGEQITVTLHAFADVPQATGQNGMNGWFLDALVSVGGVVEIVSGSVQYLAPSPWSVPDTGYTSINSPLSGQIQYLNLLTANLPQASDTGVGDYTAIATFDIKAIGLEGQSVSYTLGNSGGLLADFTTQMSGVFDAANSHYVFTIIPEPSSLLILSGFSILGYLRRRKTV